MTIPLKFLLFIVVAVILLFAFWLAYHETRTPQNQTEVMNRAVLSRLKLAAHTNCSATSPKRINARFMKRPMGYLCDSYP